jgi:hypothetical protein
MRPFRILVCCFGLMLAVAPLQAFAAEMTEENAQEQVVNAEAQMQLAQQQAAVFADQAAHEAANARAIAFLKSEAFRQAQLSNTANASAMQQIGTALADAIRSQGDLKARNALAILQVKATTSINKADYNLANAQAIGRADEIANAQAQSDIVHQLADYMTGTLAQENMSNAELIAGNAASSMQTSLTVQAQNAEAIGANELFAADTALQAADIEVQSVEIGADAKAAALLAHAEASLANAEAMLAEATP